MNQNNSDVIGQIQKNLAEGKKLCSEIEHKLDEREAVIAALRAVGIEVDSPPRLIDLFNPARLADMLKDFLYQRRK